MLSGDHGGGGDHALFVQRVRMVIDVAGQEGRADIGAVNPVLIGLGAGRLAGVEVRCNFFYAEDADGERQHIVQRLAQIDGRNGRFDHQAGGLGQCVHTGVGASGALGQGLFTGQVFDSGHQCPLNGGTVRLDLPSGEIMAVIGQRELEIARHCQRHNTF